MRLGPSAVATGTTFERGAAAGMLDIDSS